jgi:hypothetical protein
MLVCVQAVERVARETGKGGERMTYDKPKSGEWVQPVEDGHKLCCCDCGLVHTMDFRVVDGRAQFRVFRNNRATAQVRRHMTTKLVDGA